MSATARPFHPLLALGPAALAVALLAGCGGGGAAAPGGGGGNNIVPGTWKVAAQVPGTTSPTAAPPSSVGTDDAGNASVLWLDGNTLKAAPFQASAGWGNATGVVQDSVGGRTLAMSSGGAAAAWQSGAANFTIHFARLASASRSGTGGFGWNIATGTLAPPALAIGQVPDSAGSTVGPQAGIDGSGNAFVAWWTNSNNTLYVARQTAAGVWDAQAQVITADHAASSASMAVAANGDVLVAWVNSGGRVETLTYTPAGWWANSTQFATNSQAPAVPRANPRAAMDADGNATVIWSEGSTLKGSHRPAGGSWSAEATIPSGGTLGNYLLAAGGGSAIAMWDGGGHAAAAVFDPGTGWASAGNADDGAATVADLRVGMDGGGNAVALWRDGNAVMANRYSLGRWGLLPARLDGGTGSVVGPQLGVSASGTAMAAWREGNGSTSWIVAAQYAP